jgi:hypothetical protein
MGQLGGRKTCASKDVMAGLVLAVHALEPCAVTKALFRTSPPPAETISDASLKRRGVDGRAEPGHDGEAEATL